jgi:hypothetical protein
LNANSPRASTLQAQQAAARFVSRGSGSFTKFGDQQRFGHDDALNRSVFPARSDATIRTLLSLVSTNWRPQYIQHGIDFK